MIAQMLSKKTGSQVHKKIRPDFALRLGLRLPLLLCGPDEFCGDVTHPMPTIRGNINRALACAQIRAPPALAG